MADAFPKSLHGAATRLFRFFTVDIWTMDVQARTPLGRRVFALSRWVYLVIRGFLNDQCLIRASALTYTTVLSIVPFLAVAFAISKGLGLQNADFIRDMLMRLTAGRTEVVDNILGYISNTNVKTLGWMGVAMLLVTVYVMLATIEKAFNHIWHVVRGRSPWRKFTDFFSVILICPLVILLATSFTVTVQQHELVQTMLKVSAISWLEALLLELAPFFLLWLGFTFIYSFMPNAKVRFASSSLGGLVAAILWQLAQWAYISWQVGFKNYNAIYGSFAQLPLFLVWLYISWVIVLLGAEVSFAVQHLKSFTKQRFMRNAGLKQRQKMGVLLALESVRRFQQGVHQFDLADVSDRLMAPEELVMDVMDGLDRAGIVDRVEHDEEVHYTPAVDPARFTITDVLRAVAHAEGGDSDIHLAAQFEFVNTMFDELESARSASPANRTLAEYAAQAGERSFITPEPESEEKPASPTASQAS